jgi:hypothetical protein
MKKKRRQMPKWLNKTLQELYWGEGEEGGLEGDLAGVTAEEEVTR